MQVPNGVEGHTRPSLPCLFIRSRSLQEIQHHSVHTGLLAGQIKAPRLALQCRQPPGNGGAGDVVQLVQQLHPVACRGLADGAEDTVAELVGRRRGDKDRGGLVAVAARYCSMTLAATAVWVSIR